MAHEDNFWVTVEQEAEIWGKSLGPKMETHVKASQYVTTAQFATLTDWFTL